MTTPTPHSFPVLSLASPPDDGYEQVTGLDQETVALKRSYEAEVEAKVASDYSHIVWAYGIMWTLFCAFGIGLLVRGRRQAADLAALERELQTRRGD